MKKLWIVTLSLLFFLTGCGGGNDVSDSGSRQYIQGYAPYGQYDHYYDVNGNWGYPGYNPSLYDYSKNSIPYDRSVTPGYKEERGRRDRRGS